ncbi:MAG: metallophosphoesterase family protein [Bacillota bacterium]
MRIGVVSDSHGRMQCLREAVGKMGPVDLILHAGDFYEDARRLQKETGLKVVAVTGNCDWQVHGPAEEVVEAEGCRILLTHGHMYQVKYGYEKLTEKFKTSDYHMIVFGHTHIAEILPVNGGYLFNPGSVSRSRLGGPPTYGIIEVKKQGPVPYIHELSGP